MYFFFVPLYNCNIYKNIFFCKMSVHFSPKCSLLQFSYIGKVLTDQRFLFSKWFSCIRRFILPSTKSIHTFFYHGCTVAQKNRNTCDKSSYSASTNWNLSAYKSNCYSYMYDVPNVHTFSTFFQYVIKIIFRSFRVYIKSVFAI